MTTCRELLGELLGPFARCGAPAAEVRRRCPAGRPDVVKCYCDAHGGEERARVEADRNWLYLAPASVGDAEAVERAGTMQLQTPDAYVVLRLAHEEQGARWLAWIGLGSLMEPVVDPDGVTGRTARLLRRAAARGESRDDLARGTCAFVDRDRALRLATAAWSARVDQRVAQIRRARGGTLDWGVPVEPLPESIVIDLGERSLQTAWAVAVTLPRRSRVGLAQVSGLRPSGECC